MPERGAGHAPGTAQGLAGRSAGPAAPVGEAVLLGFDFGTRRIGVAIGNRLTAWRKAVDDVDQARPEEEDNRPRSSRPPTVPAWCNLLRQA